MLDSGQIIADRYELLKQLGRGGFSEVWLAQDKLTDVKVAIKIYAPGLTMRGYPFSHKSSPSYLI